MHLLIQTILHVLVLAFVPILHVGHGNEEIGIHKAEIPAGYENTSEKRGIVKLPSISEILAKNGKASFSIGSCVIDLIVAQSKFTLSPQDAQCKGKLTLETILNHFFPQNKIAQKTKSFFLPAKFSLDSLVIDKKTGDIAFKATANERFEIIARRLALLDASINLSFNFRTGNVAWEKLLLEVSGSVQVGRTKITASLNKQPDTADVLISFEIPEIKIPDFTKMFTDANLNTRETISDATEQEFRNALLLNDTYAYDDVNQAFARLGACANGQLLTQNSTKRSDGVDTDEITGVTIQKLRVSGIYNPEGSFEIVASGLPVTKLFTGTVFVIVQKKLRGATAVGFLATMENVKPAQILSKLTKKDLTQIPLLKDISLNFGTTVGSQDISGVQNEEFQAALESYGDEGKGLEKGVTLKVELPIKDIISKVSSSTDVSDVPETLFVKVRIQDGKVKFDFPKTWKTDLKRIVSAVSPQTVSVLPDWLRGKGKPSVDINEMNFDYSAMTFTIRVLAKGPIRIKDIFSLEDVDIKLIRYMKEKKTDFELSSTQKILGKITLKTSLTKEGNEFVLKGEIDQITTGQVSQWLNAKFVSDDLVKKYTFLDFGIQDFTMMAKFGGEDLKIELTGTAVLFGLRGLKFEGILYRKAGSTIFAVGIVINKIRLDEIVRNIFKKEISFTQVLSELDVALALSSSDVTDQISGFTLPGLSEVAIEKGFQFYATFKPPTDCKKEDLCLKAKEMLGGGQKSLKLDGKIQLTGAIFNAKYEGNWKVSSKVEVSDIRLTVTIGTENKVELAVTVNLNLQSSQLKFIGSIAMTNGALKLTAKLEGMWERPFGLQYVSFGDVILSVGVNLVAGLPTFEFGSTIKLGKIGNGKELEVSGNIGIDPVNVMNSYFYGKISTLTIATIAEAFGHNNVRLPNIVKNSGFPKGLMAAFSMGKEITVEDIVISRGFALQGMFRLDKIIDLEARIIVNFPKKIEVDVQMSPLKLGVLAVKKSRADQKSGPRFYVKIEGTSVAVEIQGFICILGIEAEIRIAVSNEAFEFEVEGNLFGVIGARLAVRASYGSFASLAFRVEGCISVGHNDKIESEFNKIKNEQQAVLQSALVRARTFMREMRALQLQEKREYVTTGQGRDVCFNRFEQELREYRTKAANHTVNCTDNCKRGCLGGCDWNPSCMVVDGESVGCPSWNNCRFQALDEICFAQCKQKQYLDKIKDNGRIKRQLEQRGWGKSKSKSSKKPSTSSSSSRKPSTSSQSRPSSNKKPSSSSQRPPSSSSSSKPSSSSSKPSSSKPSGSKPSGAKQKLTDLKNKGKEKVKGIIRWGKEKLKKIKALAITIEKACFTAELDKLQKKACVGLDISVTILKFGKKNFKHEVCLDPSGFTRKVAEFLFQDAVSPIKVLQNRATEMQELADKLQMYKAEVLKAGAAETMMDDNTVENSDYDEELRRHEILNPDNESMTKTPNNLVNEFTSHDDLDATSPTSGLEGKASVEETENKINGVVFATSKDIINGANDQNPCQVLKNIINGYQDLSSILKKVTEHFTDEKETFSTRKRNEITKLQEMETTLKSDCQLFGCSKDELGDAMYLIDTARANNVKWSKVVDAQILNQDQDTVQTLRRTLDDIYTRKQGHDLNEYITMLEEAAQGAWKRMSVPSKETAQQEESLDRIAKGLKDILVNNQSITVTDAAGVLQEMQPHLESIAANTPHDCQRSENDNA